MTARRGTAIASAAVATTVAIALAASRPAEPGGPSQRAATPTVTLTTSSPGTGKRPAGVVEDCSTQSGARFPGAFTNRRNLVVGPLALVGAGGTPAFVLASAGAYGGNKFPLLVRAGHRATVELSPRTRRGAGLAYGPLPQGKEVRLRDAHRVVAFIACRAGEHSRSSADGRPVTFWSGGVVARSARCIPLLVWIDAEPSPRRTVIRLGVRGCGSPTLPSK
jgi:hypothetical protein